MSNSDAWVAVDPDVMRSNRDLLLHIEQSRSPDEWRRLLYGDPTVPPPRGVIEFRSKG